MQDIIKEFLEAMHAHGITPHEPCEILPDDEWHALRATGDKPSKKVIYYRLKIDGDFGVGNFGSYREGVTHTWTTKTTRKMDEDEREAIKARIAEEKKRKEKEREEAQAKAAIDAKAMIEGAELPIDVHPYLTRKGVRCDDLPVDGDNLLVPMRDVTGKLWGVQTITPDGDKLYMRGSRKDGCFHAMNGQDKRVYIICEGLATGLSIKAAIPEHPVLCAFDAGNLIKVAQSVRESLPDVRIVIACDNDAYTTNQKGEPYNTGIEKGQQAAAKVKGFAIWPEFVDNEEVKYTDFNDLHLSVGIDAVRERILPVLISSAQEVAPAEVSLDASVVESVQASAGGEKSDLEKGDMGLPFRVLGFDEDKDAYYYYPFRFKKIMVLGSGGHSLANLMQLASLEEWQTALSTGMPLTPAQIAPYATNALMLLTAKRGAFDRDERERGIGAWMDAGRIVLHCGTHLIVDGKKTELYGIKSKYVYVVRKEMEFDIDAGQATSVESIKLRELCESLTWETKLSGSLLAGWLAIAPVCAILPWRPHIWITGESESGKSTVMGEIITPMLGRLAMVQTGGTTEASIRDKMGCDSRPLIYDEAESESQSQKNTMEGVISLIRSTSANGAVSKSGKKDFDAKFCAVLSCINPRLAHRADESRIYVFHLKRNMRPDAQEHFNKIKSDIVNTITPEFRARLFLRVINNVPTLLNNISILREVIRAELKGARIADQLAPMVAGLFLLGSTKVIDKDAATEWVRSQDWSNNTALDVMPDYQRLMTYISTSLIKTEVSHGLTREVSIGEMMKAVRYVNPNINSEYADRTLRKYSIVIKDDSIIVGHKNQNLKRLLRDTQWDANWHRVLKDIPGASDMKYVYFSPGDKQRAVKIPMSFFLGGDDD